MCPCSHCKITYSIKLIRIILPAAQREIDRNMCEVNAQLN